jgi:hypothetical protein
MVEQVDRDAAADSAPHNERWGMMVRAGHMDNDPLVQAFARHREQAIADKDAQIAALEAKVAELKYKQENAQ